jgi:cytochrome c553
MHPMMSKAITLLLALAGAVSAVQAQDAAAGQKNAAMCVGCHGIPGYQSSFPEIYKVPKVAGQNAAYIVAALTAYKKGERKHPTMTAIGRGLTDQEMADLAAFYENQGAALVKTVADSTPPAPPAAVGELLTKGACASCHGANFNKPLVPAYPKLAGQHADYLFASLRAYGVEGNPHVGRANAIMAGQVKPFKRAELKAMADYFATLPGDLRVVPNPKFK